MREWSSTEDDYGTNDPPSFEIVGHGHQPARAAGLADYLSVLAMSGPLRPNDALGHSHLGLDRMRHIGSAALTLVIGSAGAALITIYYLAHVLPVAAWVGWATSVALSSIMLLALAVGCRLARPTPEQGEHWGRLCQIAVGASGFSWGALGLVLVHGSDASHYGPFLLLMASLCAVGMYALAPIFSAFLAFSIPLVFGAVLPLALQSWSGDWEIAVPVAAIYCLAVATVRRSTRVIGQYASNDSEHERVVTALSLKQAETEQINAELLDEIAQQRRAQAELEANEHHFRALVETSGDMVWAIDQDACYTYVNGPAVEAIMGYRAEEIIGAPFTQFAVPAAAQVFDDEFFKLKEVGGQLRVDGEYRHSSGRAIHLSINAIALHDGQGVFRGASGTAVDVTKIKTAEMLLKQTLAKQEAILNSATIGIAFVQGGSIVHCNAEMEKMFGHPPGGLMGRSIEALSVADSAQAWLSTVNGAIDGRRIYDSDHICQRRDATTFWCHLSVRAVEEGSPQEGTIWVVQDISDRKQKEQVIEHTALHDALTGLPNRVLLRDRLEQAVRHAARAKLRFGVLFIDLDRFKMVNDTIGHDGGDQLLRTVGERLRMCVRNEDTVSRQGGDEFIVVLPEIHGSEQIEVVARKILHDLAKPISIFGNDYVVTGSIGISIYPDHGKDVQSLLRHADAAMYLAKEVGKNTYRVFTEELDLHATEEIRLENFLRMAIERQQLEVYYQPRVDLATGRVNSLEALARWHHPELGWVSPTKFIAVAERAGLIDRLGDWVLRRACRDVTYLSVLGHGDFGLSVNVSCRQFTRPGLVADVCKVMGEYGLNPRRLELELTESTIAQDTEQALQILRAFQAVGIGIGIDDFGTGYSSLSQLKRFPIRTLKIDRSFVAGLPFEHDDVAITLAVITMAKQLGMLIVAEGVETPEQRQFLVEHGCNEGQGYLFGKPAPLSEIVKLFEPGAALAASDRNARPEGRSEDQFQRFLSSLSP